MDRVAGQGGKLLWEESRRLYLIKMDEFSRAVEKCTQNNNNCEQPKEPRIDLSEAENLYLDLHDHHPDFRRMDLVTYLIGFAEKEAQHEDTALARFNEVIDKFPQSPLYGDAWMMVGEHFFSAAEWPKAMEAYKHIHDDAATEPVAAGIDVTRAEFEYAVTHECALDVGDILDRRTRIGLVGRDRERVVGVAGEFVN